jgi:hypothetical protein
MDIEAVINGLYEIEDHASKGFANKKDGEVAVEAAKLLREVRDFVNDVLRHGDR